MKDRDFPDQVIDGQILKDDGKIRDMGLEFTDNNKDELYFTTNTK